MRSALAFALLLVACDNSTNNNAGDDGVRAIFSLDADLTSGEHFFDFPYPSDTRLTSTGAPELTGFPNPGARGAVEQLRPIAMDRKGFPAIPIVYFRFTGALAAQANTHVIAASKDSPILIVDVEPNAAEAGHLYPVVAETLGTDDYLPANMLAVTPRPGIILRAGHHHAVVVLRALGDAKGDPLSVASEVAALASGQTPSGAHAGAVRDSLAPLWPALDKLGIARTEVAAATVFTTADVVKESFDLTNELLAKYSVQVTGLALDTDEMKLENKFCLLRGKVTYPQFQTGTPPFNQGGRFMTGSDGLPVKQRDEDAPIAITIPRLPMPPGGYPLIVYFHGSGGLSDQVANYGKDGSDGLPTPGEGPALYFAQKGIAAAASAMPVNPERLPDAGETAYLNINNLAAFRDTFRQGIIEQRLYIEALRKIQIDPALLAGCTGPGLPSGATAYSFNPDQLMAQGQSMGGMYTNLIGAIEPRVKAVVPTGAGGYWSYFIFTTQTITGAPKLLAALLGTDEAVLDFMHPTMALFETAVEAVDPYVYMPRIARRPLANHPVRPVYETTQVGDSYFDKSVYDGAALAYGNQQAGTVVWDTMQPALALEGNDGLASFPVTQNRTSEGGAKYTGVAVQYQADGNYDPHSVYRQLDSIKYQYGCFYETFLATGTATLPGPGKPGDACPR